MIPTNLTNVLTAQTDKTTQYFNNFYTTKYDVSANLNESTIGFFEKLTGNKQTAKALAGSVIHTAKMQNLEPMVILREFAALTPGQLTNYLTMFLNLNRVGTSLLGVSNAPVTNKYISRMILA